MSNACRDVLRIESSVPMEKAKLPTNILQSLANLYSYFRCLSCFYVEERNSAKELAIESSKEDNCTNMELSDSGISSEENACDILSEEENACEAMTFQYLPLVCKLEIFSYLSYEERGNAERVCSDWKQTIRLPDLWRRIDLTQFKRPNGGQFTNIASYELYKVSLQKFLEYLANIQLNLKLFRFAFDIGDYQDGWLKILRDFIMTPNVRTRDLKVAQLNWKETPVKPFKSENATWSTNNYNDLMYSHRRRQRQFVSFFDEFTANATNVTSLSMPFDWSMTTIRALGRMTQLETLALESYFIPQPLEQKLLDQLLEKLPKLQSLTLSVCVGSAPGFLTFSLMSKSVQSLDLSQCQGFCLKQMDMPHLVDMKTGLKPFVGGLTLDPLKSVSAPCMYNILRTGAPSLMTLNGHQLRATWRCESYEELESILMNVCACAIHKSQKVEEKSS